MYDVLFAPSRGKYTGKKPKVSCLFCAIRDHDPRVWTREVYRDEGALVIMNIFPYSPGHIQVLPSRHVEEPGELPDDEFIHVLDFVQRGAVLVRKVMRPDGLHLGVNLGKAGASIRHLHFQIVPRYKKPVESDQEKIHKWYLENTDIFEKGAPREEKKAKSCRCFSQQKHVFKKDPFVYLSPSPYNRGHTIISPTKHMADIEELSPREFLTLFKEVIRVKEGIERVYNPVGINIGANIGEVPNSSDHLQIHVAPRYDPESGFMEVIGGTRVVVESLDQTFEKLMKYLS